MSKITVKLPVLKKTISRLIKEAPVRAPEKVDPLLRLVRAFLEYDCDSTRAHSGESRIMGSVLDLNELRITPAIELAATLGVRYPFVESRCSALHRTLQSIFDREHHMNLANLEQMKNAELRRYLQTLSGINTYVEAVVALECFDVPAVPVDTKLFLWLISKGALPEGISAAEAQHVLENHIRASDVLDFHRGSRRELENWAPKIWPAVPKAPSPMLAPPPHQGSIPSAAKPHSAPAAAAVAPVLIKPLAAPVHQTAAKGSSHEPGVKKKRPPGKVKK
jgi:endonuclease III